MRLAATAGAVLSLALGSTALAQPSTRAELEVAVAAGSAGPEAVRNLGDFYASGRDGRKDGAEAVLWRAAAEGGDPRAPILIADHLYDEMWGRPKADGARVRTGRLPRAKAEETIRWYRLAFERDDRPEARSRAQVLALSLEMTLKAQ